MLGKIFGKKRISEDKSCSEEEKQNLSIKFIKSYSKVSQDCNDVLSEIVKPLYKAVGTDTIIEKYSHIMTDIHRKEYNSLKLNIYSQNLLNEVQQSGKHDVYEDIALQLAFKTVDNKTGVAKLSRGEDRLIKIANNLFQSYGTSYEKIRQERQDAEFAQELQKQLHLDQQVQQQKTIHKKVMFNEEEEKREIEPADYNRYSYEVDRNIVRNVSQQEMEDERLARILQDEENGKADSFAQRYQRQKRLRKSKARNVVSEDISPEEILRQRSERELSRQDYIDGMMASLPPF